MNPTLMKCHLCLRGCPPGGISDRNDDKQLFIHLSVSLSPHNTPGIKGLQKD